MPVRLALGPVVPERLAGDDVVDHLRDQRGVVADPLQVLGDEHQLRPHPDQPAVLDHVGDDLAEDGVVELVDLVVLVPDLHRQVDVARGVRVQHVRELGQRLPPHAHDRGGELDRLAPTTSGIARLAMFFARSPIRSSVEAIFIAAISTRRSAATGWRSAITFTTGLLERHLHGVERLVALDHLARQRGVAALHRLERLRQQLLAEPAHLGDASPGPAPGPRRRPIRYAPWRGPVLASRCTSPRAV